MPFNIKKAFVNIVEMTEDPTGPLKVAAAHDSAELLGRCLAGSCCNKDQVKAITKRLLSDFEDPELEQLCDTPAFITALCMLLVTSLVGFGSKQGRG